MAAGVSTRLASRGCQDNAIAAQDYFLRVIDATPPIMKTGSVEAVATNDAQHRAGSILARASLLGCALLIVILIASAYLRLSGAGLGCEPWPQCYGMQPASDAHPPGESAARLLHRVAAMLAAILVMFILVVAVTRRPVRPAERATAVVLLLVTVFLSILGRWTTGSALPAVGLANLLGGLAMLGLLWWIRLQNSPTVSVAHMRQGRTRALAWAALVLLLIQISLGGLTSVKFAALACAALTGCEGAWWPSYASADLFNPFVPLVRDADGKVLQPAGLAAIHMSHRCGALVFLALAAWLAKELFAVLQLRTLAWALLLLITLQVALGAGSVVLGLPLPVVLAHNATAAAVLLVLLTVIHRLGKR